eukprot:1178196-Amphidinium_carterae.1
MLWTKGVCTVPTFVPPRYTLEVDMGSVRSALTSAPSTYMGSSYPSSPPFEVLNMNIIRTLAPHPA